MEWDNNYKSFRDLTKEHEWDVNILQQLLPQDMTDHIILNIKPPRIKSLADKPYWSLNPKGDFTVKTVWQYIRHKEEKNITYKWMWIHGLPFKISFLVWRSWKFKLPVDDRIRR